MMPTPANPPAAKPMAGVPHITASLCQQCVVHKSRVEFLQGEFDQLSALHERAKRDLAEMSQRLDASSGASVMGRQAETILHLQKAEHAQRRANDHLEHENQILRGLCKKHDISIELLLLLKEEKKP